MQLQRGDDIISPSFGSPSFGKGTDGRTAAENEGWEEEKIKETIPNKKSSIKNETCNYRTKAFASRSPRVWV